MRDSRQLDEQEAQQARHLPQGAERLLAAPHVGVLTTLRADGSAHLAPVRFSWDDESGLVRVMTTDSRAKTRNVLANPDRPVAICQAVQFHWITLEGFATVSKDPEHVAEGIRRYAQRYTAPPPNFPGLVVIEIAVNRVMGLW